jgi:hypothetical protein
MTEIFPARYFGSLAYFKQLVRAEHVTIEWHGHFRKQLAINRLGILTSNGPLELSIPVSKPNGSKTPIHEVLICDKQDWRKNHWKAIESAYSAAPYFDYYGYEIERFLFHSFKDLKSICVASQELIASWLDLPITFGETKAYEISGDFKDFRQHTFRDGITLPTYQQVFGAPTQFVDHLSILDCIFNQGPLARNWLIEKQLNVS